MAAGAGGIEEDGFLPGIEIDDPVVHVVAEGLEVLLDHEPVPALVHLALVVVRWIRAAPRIQPVLAGVLEVHDAAERLVAAVLQCRRMDDVVRARVHLLLEIVRAEVARHVEHRRHTAGVDVVAVERRCPIHAGVEDVLLRGAEVEVLGSRRRPSRILKWTSSVCLL